MAPRVFVIVPVYNERGTVEEVLSKLCSLDGTVDGVVVVDDGSSDGSSQVIDRWARSHPGVVVLRHDRNRGYSQALLTGFDYYVQRLDDGQLAGDDIVATVDADGQHDPLELPRLVEAMEAQSLDVVWGRRDFSLYPLWKRFGNRVMSWIAHGFSGYPFTDVESGYCLFRIGALAAALEYRTRDWRYSISLTLAVIMGRLGFRLSNHLTVSVPVYRSRTRVIDAVTDTLAAGSAWAAVTLSPFRTGWRARLRLVTGLGTVAFIAVVMSLIAVKPVFLGYDSINNYVHVWFISQSLSTGAYIPLRMPWLEGGQALTYPYGFFPWTVAALIYPILGDYAVGLVMLLGFLLLILVAYRIMLRSDPWLLVLFLLHPLLMQGLLSFQLAFVWASLFGYLFVSAAQRNAKWWALLWWTLAVTTHLVIMGPLLALYAVFICISRVERRRLVLQVALLSLPVVGIVAWYTLQTPSVGYNSPLFIALTTASDVLWRGTLFFFPLALVRGKRVLGGRLVGLPSAALLAAASLAIAVPFGAFSGLLATADNPYEDFLGSNSFVPGAAYRVLEASDREQGHYYFVRRGAVLAQELFSESQVRRSWEPAAYRCFLSAKGIDYVVVNREYNRMFRTNEQAILENMTSEGLVRLSYVDPDGRFKVFAVQSALVEPPASVRGCFAL